MQLIKGGSGEFIVKRDGSTVWDKKRMGNQFPDEDVVVKALRLGA